MTKVLTFGVQLDFVLAMSYTDPKADCDTTKLEGLPTNRCGDVAREMLLQISNTLTDVGLLCRSHSLVEPNGDKLYGPCWVVAEQNTLRLPVGGDYNWLPIKINSPPFYYSSEAIQNVMLAFDKLQTRYKIVVDSSCALRIHIGHDTDGFSLPDIQNIYALSWFLEPLVLDKLHFTPDQRGWLRSKSALAQNLTQQATEADLIIQGLEMISTAHSIDAIADMISPATAPSTAPPYSLRKLHTSNTNRLNQTIEFRFPLQDKMPDPRTVKFQLRNIVRLVNFCEGPGGQALACMSRSSSSSSSRAESEDLKLLAAFAVGFAVGAYTAGGGGGWA